MQLEEVITRCKLACEAEAVASGFPASAGSEIYDGCVADDLEGWTDDQYLQWVKTIVDKYGKSEDLRRLYLKVCNIMADYTPMLKQP